MKTLLFLIPLVCVGCGYAGYVSYDVPEHDAAVEASTVEASVVEASDLDASDMDAGDGNTCVLSVLECGFNFALFRCCPDTVPLCVPVDPDASCSVVVESEPEASVVLEASVSDASDADSDHSEASDDPREMDCGAHRFH